MVWAPEYITAADLKPFVHVGDTTDDVQLALMASAANRAVDRTAHRQFGQVATPEARTYPVRYSRRRGRWIAQVDDLQTAVGAIYPATVDPPTLEPRNAVLLGLAWTHMVWRGDPSDADDCGMVTITASWGWLAVPSAVKLASLLQGSRLAARRDSPFGVAGSPDQGAELRLLDRVDPDVATSLAFYRRDWWCA